MKNPSKPKTTKCRAGRKVRFPRIFEACAALGCSRTHLYYVLTGQRTSRSLMARYEAWKEAAE